LKKFFEKRFDISILMVYRTRLNQQAPKTVMQLIERNIIVIISGVGIGISLLLILLVVGLKLPGLMMA
jgi:hypothetical protein